MPNPKKASKAPSKKRRFKLTRNLPTKPLKLGRKTNLKADAPTNGILAFDFKRPTSYDQIKGIFGSFEWHDIENSRGADVTVDPQWVAANIVKVELPGVLPKPVYLHKRIAKVFKAAVIEAQTAHPTYKIVSCASYVPRHKRHDRRADLSLHTWGIAFDINPSKNPYGAYVHISKKPPNDPPRAVNIYYDIPDEVVAVFEKYGFFWGGRFKQGKDPMHFQAATGV